MMIILRCCGKVLKVGEVMIHLWKQVTQIYMHEHYSWVVKPEDEDGKIEDISGMDGLLWRCERVCDKF